MYQSPTLKNVSQAFGDFFDLLCDADFVKTHGIKSLWTGERQLLVPLRFFLAARFWHTYVEKSGWKKELGRKRIDFFIGDVAVEFAASTQNGDRYRLSASSNRTELEKLAASGCRHKLLVLYDLCGLPPDRDMLDGYGNGWKELPVGSGQLTVIYYFANSDGKPDWLQESYRARRV